MKFHAIAAAALLLFTAPAQAASFTATGAVQIIRVHEGTASPGVAQDWFAVVGFGSAGTCGTSSGRVVLIMRDDERGKRMLSLATSALLSGKTVTVNVDDSKKVAGFSWCFIQSMSLNP